MEKEKVVEIYQSFPEMTKKKLYRIKYSKKHIIVDNKIVAYFKKPGIWVTNNGENSI